MSSFSSLMLLIKKKVSTWRFCVVYRALIDSIIKDEHPIYLFFQTRLRARCQQIRIAEANIEKTTFRIHDGNFEFFVMPFRLTNAPIKFQHCSNDFFRPYLRKFILVFLMTY